MPAKRILTEEEKKYITDNSSFLSVHQISKDLKLSERIISSFIRTNNLIPKKTISIGQRYGRLVVIEEKKKIGKIYKARCKCDCGNEKDICIGHMKMGKIRSCGCLEDENRRKGNPKYKYHSQKSHTLYKRHKKFFCQEWLNPEVFEKWLIENDYLNKGAFCRHNNLEPYSSVNAFLLPKRIQIKKEKINRRKKQVNIGDTFGRLTVIGEPFWVPKQTVVVECSCGVIKAVATSSLINKDILSCGCYHLDLSRQNMINGNFANRVCQKYGVKNYAHHKDFKSKVTNTCMKRYGVSNYSQTLESRKNASVKRTKILINGKTLLENAIHKDYSYLHFSELVRRYGQEEALKLSKRYSSIEQVLHNFLTSLNIKYSIQPKLGIYYPDIVIDSHNIIIELDGLYWHSDRHLKDKYYHVKKKEFYNNLGYQALFFREDEIIDKIEIVKSIVLNKLGMSKKVFARKCELKEVVENKSEFFENNHLMGKGAGKVYGLYYNQELIAAIQTKHNKEYVEISRFCTRKGISVIGGFTKLLNRVKEDYKKPIMTFIDRRYGDGAYLVDLGFKLSTKHLSFKWTKKTKSLHRLHFSDKEAYEQGWYKIWDCGQYKYVEET